MPNETAEHRPVACLCPASEFWRCGDTECQNSGANAAEEENEDPQIPSDLIRTTKLGHTEHRLLICLSEHGGWTAGQIARSMGYTNVRSKAQIIRRDLIRMETIGWVGKLDDQKPVDKPQTTRPRVWNMRDHNAPAGAVYGGRGSPIGNPFRIGPDGTRDEVCDKFQAWAPTQPAVMAFIATLQGRDLRCFCKPLRCHLDWVLRTANPALFCEEIKNATL